MDKKEPVKCIILGSGPAGYTAAIYTSRANLSPILYQGHTPGGQLTITTDIENFPGHPDGVSGTALMEMVEKQAGRFGADLRRGMATKVDFSKRPFKLTIDDTEEILAETVIIATGATAKYLGLESEQKFMGMGVSACATCDGFFYRGKTVAVIGGGDTACEEAIYLAQICKKAYLVVRKNFLRASKAMQHKLFTTPNIEVIFEHNVKEVLGDDSGVTALQLAGNDNTERRIEVDGIFLAIGHHPNTEPFKEYLNLNELGYIITEPGTTKTNIEGIFAAGDVQDPNYRQAIVAAGSGCMAAIDCERFLAESDDQAQ